MLSKNIDLLREDIWRELNSGAELHDANIRVCQKWATVFSPVVIGVNVGLIASKDFVCGEIPFRSFGIITDLTFVD